MIDFIKSNIDIIVLVGACLVDIILFVMPILKKKSDPSLMAVIADIPSFVSSAEAKIGSGNGEKKKLYVLDLACRTYRHLTGVAVSKDSFVYRCFSRAIEDVLFAPHKKER